jgi:ABC-2 type transport system ATP-binding protein
MTEPSLSLKNLVMSYREGQRILRDISLSLEPGSVTGLLGINGAGKTTLMRIALGLLRPTSGTAELFGEPAWQASEETRSRIGYVAQSEAPFNWMKVTDSLNLVGSFYDNWDHALISKYVSEWNLDPRAYIQDLSQGQRQKVSILMAIGHKPDLLVLDEPVASLDPGARRQFLQAPVELNQDLNRTILFSTHITSDIERVAANVAVLHDGTLQFNGELDELKECYQRLYLTGASLPDSLGEPGIENYQRQENRATAFAKNWNEDQTHALSNRLGVNVEAESLPLEELFLELTYD